MEQELIAWLVERAPRAPGVRLGIGDDAAVLTPSPESEIAVTTDMLMDRVDFVWGTHDPALIGRKSLAVNLSDLAAMAARPVAAFVSLAIPRSFSIADVQSLMGGMLELAREYEMEIAGGDTNTYDGPLVISVTAIGETPKGRAWTRGGAQTGDRILVSGPLGGSLTSRQFTFTPRVREALAWREAFEIHAAIDISDGFSLDLSRLLQASRRGAVIDEAAIPIHGDAIAMSAAGSGKTPLAHALGDGEDFELVLTASPAEAAKLKIFAKSRGQAVFDVGEITNDQAMFLLTAQGELEPLPPTGYQHRLSS